MSECPVSVSRREVLVGAGAVAASSLLPGQWAAASAAGGTLSGASKLGGWLTDSRHLPVYRVTADLPLATVDAKGKPFPLDPDPFFLLGNYRVTAFAHVSGLLRIVTGERGWTRVNEPLEGTDQNSASLAVTREGATKSYSLLGLHGVSSDSQRSVREFGCGFARYDLTPDRQIRVVRTVSVAPSQDDHRGLPALVVHVKVINTGSSACDIAYTEAVLAHSVLVIERNVDENHRAVRFTNRVEIDSSRSFVAAHPAAHSDDPGIMRAPKEASKYNLFPPSLVLIAATAATRSPDATPAFSSRDVEPGATELQAVTRVHLAHGEARTLVYVLGLAPEADPAELLGFAQSLPDPSDGVYFGEDWRKALSTFQGVKDPVFRRELTWDTHALLAMATYNSFYDQTFIPQGMTYDYQMDLTAAPRDHFQHAMAACYFRPSLAKSTLRYILSKMTLQGEIKYMDSGFGKTSNSAWNTSDQQLYFFQSLGEYLRITGDYAFLNEKTTYLPREAGFEGTVLEKLDCAMSYLRDEVSTGPHGLVRLMNSDWSDMVFADISVLQHFATAESHMNSAMVVAVVPNLLRQLERYSNSPSGSDARLARRVASSLELYLRRIQQALYDDLGDRTFSRRLYFDPGHPFGDDNLHIEPQSFLLQADSFPIERKRRLWSEVQSRLLAAEKLGPRQRERPVVGATMLPYTSENGGIWYSLCGQMIIGVATFDQSAALSLLRMITFDNFARQYPTYWTGLWSAADTVNAVGAGDIAGLPRPDNDGLWTRFASYCAHPHAWAIYAWARIAEMKG